MQVVVFSLQGWGRGTCFTEVTSAVMRDPSTIKNIP